MAGIFNYFRRPDEKELGNDKFKDKEFDEAILHYTQGLEQCRGSTQAEERAKLLANRSAALVGVEDYRGALADAEECCALRPSWPKGWARKGKALTALSRHKAAAAAYARGLEASLRASDASDARHAKELAGITSQATAASDRYLELLAQNEKLQRQLDDYTLMFSGDDGKAKIG